MNFFGQFLVMFWSFFIIISTKTKQNISYYNNQFSLRSPVWKGVISSLLEKKRMHFAYYGINERSQEIANFVLLWTCPASVLADFLICVDSCNGILLNHKVR